MLVSPVRPSCADRSARSLQRKHHRTPHQGTESLPGGLVDKFHMFSKCENLAAPCCPQEFYLLQWHRNHSRKFRGLLSPCQCIRPENYFFFNLYISQHQTNRLNMVPQFLYYSEKKSKLIFFQT